MQWWCERLSGFHSGLIDVKSAKLTGRSQQIESHAVGRQVETCWPVSQIEKSDVIYQNSCFLTVSCTVSVSSKDKRLKNVPEKRRFILFT